MVNRYRRTVRADVKGKAFAVKQSKDRRVMFTVTADETRKSRVKVRNAP
jgi:hypothetical protein